MTNSKFCVGLVLSYWLSLPTLTTAQNNDYSQADNTDIPDQELLEFIADVGHVDDETFDLMIYHGKKDLEKNDEPATSQEPDYDH